MRLLVVTDYFYPHWTGISKSLWSLVERLKQEYKITILTVRYERALAPEERIRGTTIIREPYLFTVSRAKYSFALVVRLLAIIREYDAIFVNSPCSNILPVSLLAKLFGKKLLIFHQGDLVLPAGFNNRLIEKVFDITTKLSFRLASRIATYTHDYAKHSKVMKHYLYKFSPLLMPIGTDSVELVKNKKHPMFETILFGFAGRFVEEKGFDILLDAIPRIVKRLPNARFFFAGETNIPYERFFQRNKRTIQKVKKYLTFLGLLRGKKLLSFYQMIDFIVIPSRSDCFNLVQAEAMLAGTPSIVADIPGARWLVKKTGFGLLFKKEDSPDLARKALELVRKKNQISQKYKNVQLLLNNRKIIQSIKNFIES